jgi:transcriptional regulator with XRE-family HTH domain
VNGKPSGRKHLALFAQFMLFSKRANMARSTNNKIQLALDRALDGLAVVETVESKDEVARVLIRSRARNYRLRALWAGAGWPADVERAIRHLGEEWPPDLVVVARSLSAGSREMLERRGASWADGSGDAHIVARDLLVMREAKQQPGADRRAFSWSPSAVSIAEALLNRKSPYGVRATELAMLTGWSTPQISQVLGAFDAEGWTTKWGPQRGPGASREVADGARMLDAWAEEVSAVKPERRFAERIFNDPMQFLVDELGPVLDNHDIGWAVTGWAAAERLAPFATAVPALQVYVEERALRGPLSQAMQDIPVREVASGGRIEFRSADSHLLKLAARRNGIPLATAPRVFADLQVLGGRGEDAAMHLREEVILNNLRPRRRRTTSADMSAWDKRCRKRLKKRIADELGGVETVYDSGIWSVSYWIPEVTLPFGELRDALVAVEGRETGWPPWWVPTREGIQPEVRHGAIECWFRDDAARNYGHADFWRVEPELKLFLLRGYQEDGITGIPGSSLDPVLPIWRMAESLLHSARMARYVDADDIEFFARWDGLEDRELRTVTTDRWDFGPGHVAHDDSIATVVTTSPEEIEQNLPSVVRALVSSLFEAFGLFDPPGSLYATEIATMLEQSRGQTGG